MGLFEWSVGLHTFARALISVFIPVLLLGIGYGIDQVLLFLLLLTVMDVPLNFFARWLVRKVGARLVIIAGSVAMVGYFLSLSALQPNDWVALAFVSFFAALYDALYWVSHLFFFMECSVHKENISRDTSWLYIVQQLAEMLAPALGAVVLLIFPDDILMYISVTVVLISIIPLFKIKNAPDRPRVPQQPWTAYWGSWQNARDYFRIALYGVHMSVEFIIYPLFLYFLIGNVESVAAVAVIAALAMMVFTFFTGRIKREHRQQTIITGALIAAVFWLLRIFIVNYAFVYFSVFVVGLCAVMMSIPLASSLFEKGEKMDTLSASTWRNAASMGGQALLYGVLLLANNIFHISFIVVVGCLVALLIISRLAVTIKVTQASQPL